MPSKNKIFIKPRFSFYLNCTYYFINDPFEQITVIRDLNKKILLLKNFDRNSYITTFPSNLNVFNAIREGILE